MAKKGRGRKRRLLPNPFAKRRKGRRRSGKQAPGGGLLKSFLWFSGGLVLGLLLLLPLFYLGGPRPDSSDPAKRAPGTDGDPGPTKGAEATQGDSGQKQAANGPTRPGTSPSREEDPGEGMNYRFYTLLPEMEVKVSPGGGTPPTDEPDGSAREKAPQAPRKEETAGPPEGDPRGRFLLQVASFRKSRSAEEMKARLAMRGLQAEVVEAEIEDRGTWYRVRLGPYSDRSAAEEVKSRLAEAGMRSLILQR